MPGKSASSRPFNIGSIRNACHCSLLTKPMRIPALLAGRDVIGQAQTGTGKTAAFALPILQRLDLARAEVQALVLTPTRELAIQVAEAIHTYGKALGSVRVLPVYGGQGMHLQV